MKDILQDIVSHTQNLGFLTTVKITGTDKGTTVNSMADDRSVIMEAETANPYPDMIGVFGMPQLNKLKYLLEGAEYKEGAKISITTAERNGETLPVGLHFENKDSDFLWCYTLLRWTLPSFWKRTVGCPYSCVMAVRSALLFFILQTRELILFHTKK
jgi:hypothetical protein